MEISPIPSSTISQAVPFAEVVFMQELFNDYHVKGQAAIVEKQIRITGIISSINYVQRYCILEDFQNQLKLYVDISLVDNKILKLDDLFQFIGTITSPPTTEPIQLEKYDNCEDLFLLKATVARNVTGLDLNLFEKTIQKRREFLHSLQNYKI